MIESPVDNWTLLAACNDPEYDPNWWHSEHPMDVIVATDICRFDCPVREVCLREARDRGESWGIWGGVEIRKERRDSCKNGHPRHSSMKTIGGTLRCEPCYRQAQAKIAAKRASERAAARAALIERAPA